jgi:hypothetical protein
MHLKFVLGIAWIPEVLYLSEAVAGVRPSPVADPGRA